MKELYYVTKLAMLIFAAALPSLSSAQFTTIAVQDFDTVGTPALSYTSTGTMTYAKGLSPANSDIPNTPYGVNNTRAWYSTGSDLTTTFSNVNITGYDTAFISFKLAALFDVDAGDYVLVSISVDGGTTWYDRVRINGNGSNCSWAYSATGVVDHLFAPVNTTTTYTPPTNGVSLDGPSTIQIRVPNTTNQVRVKIRQRESTSSEGYYLDDLTIKVRGVTYNNAAVTGLVSPVNFCSGTHDVKVRIKNKGQNILNNVTVNWSVNGVTQGPYYFLSPLDTAGGTGPKDTVLTLSSLYLAPSSVTNIKVWTSDPNYTTDGFPQDDTMNFVLRPSLSGNYTIGGASPDYPTIVAAVNDLNTYGVCGPVQFNVAAGTYASAINVGNVQGASSVNTIEFTGANSNTTIISSTSTAASTVTLSSSRYVTFKNFTINNNTTTDGTGFAFTGQTNKCAVNNCIVNFPNSIGYSTYGIIVTGEPSGNGASNNHSDSVRIDSNIVNNAYYGIYVSGDNASTSFLYNRDFKIRGNTVNKAYYMGIVGEYVYNAIEITNNKVLMDSLGDTYSFGIYMYECTNDNPANMHNISYNIIKNAGAYGLYDESYGSGSVTTTSLILNNSIGGGFRNSGAYALYVYESAAYRSLIYHNSVNLDVAQTSIYNSPLYYYGSSTSEIKNNILAYSSEGGAGMAMVVDASLASGNINNNIYYNASGSNLVYLNGTIYTTANYRTLTAGGNQSLSLKPSFISGKDLHVTNGCLRGAALSTVVSFDIDGTTRPLSPMIGADEISLSADNVSVEAIAAPKAPVTPGLQDVVVVVKNMGNNPVYSFNVSYELNNAFPVTQLWQDTLNTCDTVSVTFTGFYQGNFNAINTVKAYTSFPNAVNDSYSNDDTLTQGVYSPLNGVYTIGNAPSDFADFTSAIDALKGGGVSGSVLFNVKTGTYNEAINLNTPVAGISKINTVTFRSVAGHRDSVIMNNSLPKSTVTLNNISHMSFHNITFSSADINFSRVFDIAGTSSYIEISGCRIKSNVNGTHEGIYANGLTGRCITIKNNLIEDAYMGVYIYGASSAYIDSTIVDSNIFQSISGYGGYFYYTKNLKFRDNKITGSMSYGIRTYYSTEELEILRNNINITATYGMYIYYSNGTVSKGSLVANNSVRVTGTYGIRNYYGSYQKFYNNSISVTGTYPAYISYNSASYTNNEWKNNIFHTTSTASSSYAAYIVGNVNATNVFDYNIYYTASTNNFIYYTQAYATFAAYRAAYPAQDANSLNVNPAFTSTTNLAPSLTNANVWYMNGRGVQTINSTDINNNARSTTMSNGAPDIGAYEFTPAMIPPVVTASPVLPAAGTTQIFKLLNDTIATIEWAAASSVPTSISLRFYSGEFAPQTNTSHYRTNCYWDIQASGSGFYNYNINLYYKEPMKGSVAVESNMRLAKNDGVNPWVLYTGNQSAVDATRNILSASFLTSFSYFTGTDDANPLPVKLDVFNAVRTGKDVVVNWVTAHEKNASHFIVEFSSDGSTFLPAGKVSAKGNSELSQSYRFVHSDAQSGLHYAQVLWYRLVSVDRDGGSEISKTVPVRFNDQPEIANSTIYPNPFNRNLSIQIPSLNGGEATIELMNLQGQKEGSLITLGLVPGMNEIDTDSFANLAKGIYLMRISCGNESTLIKLIKQ